MYQMPKMVRMAVEHMYNGKCTVYELAMVRDPKTNLTVPREKAVNAMPCHLFYSGSPSAAEVSMAAQVSQSVVLFIAPDIMVKPGSRIEVTQDGRTESYAGSGMPSVYQSHQEITLEAWKGWA